MNFNKLRRLAPFVFWVFQIIINFTRNFYVIATKSFLKVLQPMLITYPLDFITFSLFYFLFTPRFYKKKDLKFLILISIIYPFIYGFVWITIYYLSGLHDLELLKLYYFSSFGHTLSYAFYGIVFRLAIDWFENREKRKELEKQNIKTELALLRSQINPHFLFNILNNINSFAQNSSEKTSFAIIKLSELMRYMLYEAKEDKVFIEKEIKHIENYIELQKMRFKIPGLIEFDSSCSNSNIKIPPMLFIPFIENAFKHGKKSTGSKIKIQLEASDTEIKFSCTNQIRILNETERNEPGGIGIENIKRRLQIIYPEKHTLNIKKEDDSFNVSLKILRDEN
ncbi:MAG: histidine kinase [Bacteroidetes bacterium]|nr:histidine kinase [Bacteroidota bacterium]